MIEVPPAIAGRVIGFQQRQCPDYKPETANLPVRESSFVQLGRGRHAVDVQLVTAGDVGLSRLGISAESVGINVLKPDYIGFVIPISWTGSFHINGDAVSQSAIYMSGDLDSIYLRSKSRDTLGVTLPKALFVQAVAALRGVDIDEISLTERELRLSESTGLEIRAQLTSIINNVCGESAELAQLKIGNAVKETLVNAYLQAFPEPDLKAGRTYRPESIVRLTEERFSEFDGQVPLSLSDLCQAAGVGKSSIYKAFHSICGEPPLSYFRKRRLMQARTLLLNARNEHGAVRQVAMDCGFTELGRFSVQYRQMFGESPSLTLNRAGI